jgi:hypothetical protein
MSDENKFWLGLWALGAIVVIALISACVSTAHHKLDTLQDMVAKGANPMAASCALGVGQNEIGVCTLLATQVKETK